MKVAISQSPDGFLGIEQTSGLILSLGFSGSAPASIAASPVVAARATDVVLIERGGVLMKVAAADLLAAVIAALPTDEPATIGAPWLDNGVLAVVQP